MTTKPRTNHDAFSPATIRPWPTFPANGNASMVQIHATNCTIKLGAQFYKAGNIEWNNLRRAAQERVMKMPLCAEQALPLRNRRIPRLAQISPMAVRSPARRQRDDRAMSGRLPVRCLAALPRMAGQWQRQCRRMSVKMARQDNLLWAGRGRAMSTLETCETTRNLAAQRPRNFPAMAGQWQRQCRRASVKTTCKTACLAPDVVAQNPCRSPPMASATSRK